jgi:tripartite-type tricarboxylate transporter receptor subunit TctC
LRRLLHIRNACVLCATALILGIAAAAGQSWPTRFVTLIVPFGAGSGTDVVARIIGAQLSEVLGKQVVVENVAGAGGTLGVSRVAKAPPDGYQMVIGAVDTFAQSQYLFKNPPYNSTTDFEPVALAVEQPLVLIVRKNLPVESLQEFAAYLKANQDKMRFGSAGVGAAPYLACAMLTSAIGATATHVPYRSAPPALQDMISGDIDYYCPLAISAIRLIENKSVKVLAVLTRERSPVFPDLPTAREQGVDVTDGYYWNGFFVPKGTPEPIVAALNGAIRAALDNPAVQTRIRDVSAAVVAPERRSSAYFRDYLASEIPKWAVIMKASGVAQQ